MTDTKKEKEYNTTYKTVSSGAQKLLKKDLGDSRINPLFVNTELEKCAELAKERNYTEAIRALEELQSQLGVMATNKAKVLRFINECIQDIEALGKKSSIGLVTSVINSSEEIIRKFNQHGSVEVTEMIETLKEKLVDAKNLRDKK